jgi:hypothetical protein
MVAKPFGQCADGSMAKRHLRNNILFDIGCFRAVSPSVPCMLPIQAV